MNHEYQTKAWIDGKLEDVLVSYEVDDHVYPLIYGVFNDNDEDVTELIHPDEFDRIYTAVSADLASSLNDAADYMAER